MEQPNIKTFQLIKLWSSLLLVYLVLPQKKAKKDTFLWKNQLQIVLTILRKMDAEKTALTKSSYSIR